MKIIKIILVSLLSLIIAVALAWFVLKYMVWPTRNMQELIPGEPMAYVTARNLSENLPAAGKSEFASRIARSPFWAEAKSSGMWRQIEQRKAVWEKQTEASLNPEGILQLVGKDAVLALYREQDRWGFLLISQLGLLTRMNIMSGSTERMMESMHEFTKEKYRGVQIMTVKGKGWEFSYGIIGRTGILSLDKSILKKTVDVHRKNGKGLAATPGFKDVFADMPGSPDASLYVNTAKIQDTVGLSALTSLMGADYLESFVQGMDAWTCAGLHRDGKLRLDIRMSRAADEKLPGQDFAPLDLAVPEDCLFFTSHETLNPQFLLEMLKVVASLDTNIISERLMPVLDDGMAVAVFRPGTGKLQMVPPAMIIICVRDKASAEMALSALENSMGKDGGRLVFNEEKHGNTPIRYATIPLMMGISLEASYAIIGDDLLVLATDRLALKSAIDVFSGKQKSLMKNKDYAGVIKPIAEASDGKLFMNIGSAVPVIKQLTTLYALRAKIAGDSSAEKIAMTLHQNAFILEAWKYMGATLYSDGDKIDMKLILSDR